jgi:hypothetical protein
VFGKKGFRIHIGRLGGAPAAIFNPVLAALERHLGNLDQVEVSEFQVSQAADYIHCAVQFYDKEKLRQDAIKSLVNLALGETDPEWGIAVEIEGHHPIKPEHVWRLDDFIMGALELKNILGIGGDALSQAIVDYVKIISRKKVGYLISLT